MSERSGQSAGMEGEIARLRVSGVLRRLGPYEETVERAPVGIAHFDMTGRFSYANPQLCAIFGYSREELLELTFQEISFPGDLPRCLEMSAQLAAGSLQKYTLEKRFVRPDGSTVYVRVIVNAIRDAAGSVSHFLGIVEDLSEQWASEQARRLAEERLALALEASGTGIYQYDFRRQGLDFSNGLAKVFGFPEGDSLQGLDRLLGAIHPDDLPRVLEAYQRSATEGADFEQVFRIVLPGGSIRWIDDRARMTLGEDGRPKTLTGACIDVTARQEAEEGRELLLALEQSAREQAERAIQLRDDVLAIVAHDLRNPVHTILMSAGAMAELPLTPEETRQQIALQRRAAAGMDRLIGDLLDVARIETGRLAVHLEPVELSSLLDEVVALHRPLAAERGLALEGSIAPGLHASADKARFVQVMGNLIGNSFKFTPRGGRIHVRARAVADSIHVSVEDTGMGIAATDLGRVFEPYWQADRSTRQGVGLGLAIVRGIMEAHAGAVSVHSTLGQGTTFTLTLPAGR